MVLHINCLPTGYSKLWKSLVSSKPLSSSEWNCRSELQGCFRPPFLDVVRSTRESLAFREFCSSLRRRNFLGMLLIALCNPSERIWIFALSHGKGWKTEEGGLWLFCSKS